jgi:predicted component of type VI protein secretion system
MFAAPDVVRPVSLTGERAARVRDVIDGLIANIDALIAAQFDAILHHRRLRRLEGSWRGLAWLVYGVPPGAAVKVRLLNLPWPELCRDLERAAEFDQSQLFCKVYEEAFGFRRRAVRTAGGGPRSSPSSRLWYAHR